MRSDPTQDFVALSRFDIRRQLGTGGMGVVYEAFDRQLGKLVAIKTVRQVTPDSLYALKREFRLLADLVHPNLVRLFELFASDDSLCFSMELLSGKNFLNYVRTTIGTNGEVNTDSKSIQSTTNEVITPHGELTLASGETSLEFVNARDARVTINAEPSVAYDDLRRLLVDLAEGVSFLHSRNRLHRDIKPSNIMVCDDGRAVLLDYGLAIDTSSASRSAQAGIAGTFPYMAPEQCAGEKLTFACDWYAVGVILYEALVGSRPFVGKMMEVVLAKQTTTPARPSTCVLGIPSDLDAICMQLLERDPIKRADGRTIRELLTDGQLSSSTITSPKQSRQRETIFVGREREMDQLHLAFESVTNGNSVVMLVQGESGVGKSTLIENFLNKIRQTDSSVVTLTGKCYERESIPFKALDDLVDELVKYWQRLTPVQAAELLPRDMSSLARLFPAFLRVEAVAQTQLRSVTSIDQKELRRNGFSAFREFLGRLSDRHPLIIFIDDFQWADLDGLALLTETLCPPHQPSMLLIISHRADSGPNRTMTALRSAPELTMAGILRRDMTVLPLGVEQATELALQLTGRQSDTAVAIADAVARESGGNPYFVDILSRLWHDLDATRLGDCSDMSLKVVIAAWLARLPELDVRLLEILSVAGHPIYGNVLLQIEPDDLGLRQSLNRLCSERLVKTSEFGDRFEPFHDRIRETILQQLSQSRMAQCHLQIANALDRSGAEDPATIARHFEAAGDKKNAAKYYEFAAESAYSSLAFEMAADLYHLVLAGTETTEKRLHVERRLADSLAFAGRSGEAAAIYLQLADLDHGTAANEYKRNAAFHYLLSGQSEIGIHVLKEVVKSAGLSFPRTFLGTIAQLIYYRGRSRLSGYGLNTPPSPSQTQEFKARIAVCRAAAHGLVLLDTPRALSFFSQDLFWSRKLGDPSDIAIATAWEGTATAMGGWQMKKRSDQLFAKAQELSDQVRNPYVTANVASARAFAQGVMGLCEGAMQLSDSAIKIFREECTGAFYEQTLAEGTTLWIASFSGDLAILRKRVPAYFTEGKRRNDTHRLCHVANLVLLPLADDEPDIAESDLQLRLSDLSEISTGFHHFLAFLGQFQIHLYRGDNEAAIEFCRTELPKYQPTFRRFQFARIMLNYLLACAELSKSLKGEHSAMNNVSNLIGQLTREQTPLSGLLVNLLNATILLLRNEKSASVELLKRAILGLKKHQMPIYAFCAQARLAQIVPENGQLLPDESDNWFKAQQIAVPSKMMRVFLPSL